MPKTYDLPTGEFFHFIKVKPGTPLKHWAMTQEVEVPFRNSLSCVVRLWPFRIALVAGKWYPSGLHEDEALLAALGGRSDALDVVDEEGHLVDQFERA